jgi:hypothetical protein
VTAVTGDAISNEEIRRVDIPSRINFWASAVTGTDELSVLLNRTEILPACNVNVEIAADVIDVSRDQLLFGTVVGRGQLRVPVSAVTTEIQFLLSVEPLALG